MECKIRIWSLFLWLFEFRNRKYVNLLVIERKRNFLTNKRDYFFSILLSLLHTATQHTHTKLVHWIIVIMIERVNLLCKHKDNNLILFQITMLSLCSCTQFLSFLLLLIQSLCQWTYNNVWLIVAFYLSNYLFCILS